MNDLETDKHSPKKRTRGSKPEDDTGGPSSRLRKYDIVFVNKSESADDEEYESYEDDESYDDDDESDDDDDDTSSSSSIDEDEDTSVSSVDTAEVDDYDIEEDTMQTLHEQVNADYYINKLSKEYAKNKSVNLSNMIEACKEYLLNKKIKDHVKKLKTERKYTRVFSKHLRDTRGISNNDVTYFDKCCSEDDKYKLIKKLKEVSDLTLIEKPHRIKIIESDIPLLFKSQAIQKLDRLRQMDPSTGEYCKIKSWIDDFMKIPFGQYVSMPVHIDEGIEKCATFMERSKQLLDQAVYGLTETKMQIMQLLGQLISNPSATGTSIAIHGDKGVGKTSIVQDGISKILNRPFAFIPLGGATDASYLEGHSYTYEGSVCGKIVQILMDCKVMNPVIYFDELDKLSDTPKGSEIANILIHLTDTTQNFEFHDKYFSNMHFDLSKCIFIFSYNDETKINPVLKDRMYTIRANGYSKADKIEIAKQYLTKKIAKQVNFSEDDICFTDSVLGHIIDRYCPEEAGVRSLKRCLETIYTKLNLCRLMRPGTSMFDKNITVELVLPCTLTHHVVDALLKPGQQPINKSLLMMYI
jgi:ATP-dependent Lon protease